MRAIIASTNTKDTGTKTATMVQTRAASTGPPASRYRPNSTMPMNGTTIPHEVIGEFGAGKVLLRPASQGTGIIAGRGVRPVMELAGIQDVLTKSLGSSNPYNVVYATIEALKNLRSAREISEIRGLSRRREKGDEAEVGSNGIA